MTFDAKHKKSPRTICSPRRRGAVATLEIIPDGFILSVYDICLNKLSQAQNSISADSSAHIAAQLYAQLQALGLHVDQLLGIHTKDRIAKLYIIVDDSEKDLHAVATSAYKAICGLKQRPVDILVRHKEPF